LFDLPAEVDVKTVYGLDAPDLGINASVLLIGNFDGVHLGHQRLLTRGAALASHAGVPLVVLTFEPHPTAILRPKQTPERLMTLDAKLETLQGHGVDIVVVAASTTEFLSLEAERFVELVVDRLHPIHVVEGSTFGFGKGRRGTPELLQSLGRQRGFDVCIIDPVTLTFDGHDAKSGVAVSSSVVRRLIAEGNVGRAARCLGRDYELRGRVVPGAGRGAGMGFPTANVGGIEQLIPGDGVYAGTVRLPDALASDGGEVPAGISVGTNPTFGGTKRRVEAHLIGQHADLLDTPICVRFGKWLRGQRKFESAEALAKQIATDVENVREWARGTKGREIR